MEGKETGVRKGVGEELVDGGVGKTNVCVSGFAVRLLLYTRAPEREGLGRERTREFGFV